MPADWHDADYDDPWEEILDGAEVPAEFCSEYLSGPFVRCIDCDAELLESEEAYSIIKSYVAGETVFEMAICGRCSVRLAESYSDESRAAFEASLGRWKEQRSSESEDSSTSTEPGLQLRRGDVEKLAACAACGRLRSECHRYSIVGAFLGPALVTSSLSPIQLPLLICDECNSSACENISRQTRDSWDRFVEDHFDGPPGIELDSPTLDPVLI